MLNILKKFWFVIIVACLFIGLFVYVTYDENKGKLKGLKSNGQDVLFTIGDEKITAEMLYAKISESNKTAVKSILLDRFQVMTLMQSMPITKEMKQQAADAVYNNVVAFFQINYGNSYETYLRQWMQNNGFSELKDIEKYTLPYSVIRPKLINNYFKEHLDEYYEIYFQAEQPRLISHILVLMEDPEEPSEEELQRVAAIDAALKTKNFSEVATELSEDSGSAEQGGSIGIVSNSNKTDYVAEFAAVAMELKENEVSPWTATTYGWHRIKNDGNSKAALIADPSFYSLLASFNSDVSDRIIYDTAVKIGLNFFGNDDLAKYIMDELGGGE